MMTKHKPIFSKASALSDTKVRAKSVIKSEREGLYIGPVSRWDVFNYAIIKHFRDNLILHIAGASGAGKSYFLNMLKTDMTDYEPIIIDASKYSSTLIDYQIAHSDFIYENGKLIRYPISGNVTQKWLFVHFNLEMPNEDDLIRTVSSMTGYDHRYILSSRGTKQGKRFVYDKLSMEENEFLNVVIDAYVRTRNSFIMTFRKSPTLDEFHHAIRYCKSVAEQRGLKLCVGVDHSLLLTKNTEVSDQELHDNYAKTLIDVKAETEALLISLVQMNSNIEDDRRRANNSLHYPTKKDIYRGGQMFQAADDVYTMFAPASIGIPKYGPHDIPTKNLIHLSKIKGRMAGDGQIWLKKDFEHGKLYSIKIEVNKKGKFTSGTIQPNLIRDFYGDYDVNFPN